MKNTIRRSFQKILQSCATPCVLIVLLSVLLHSMSLPIFTVQPEARGEYCTEGGLPYLSEMDSYLYARLTEDLATQGFSAYTLRHSRGEDPYISANATGEEGDVVMGLPILGATVYKLFSWIPGLTPYTVIFWLAPIIASLTAVPAYVFVRRRTNRLGGTVAGLLVAVAAPFAAHTHAGFYDTDLGLSLLPCLFLLCFAECLLTRDLRKQLAWAAGSGFALCALATFWRAYYAYFCIGAAAAFATAVACLIVRLVRYLRIRRKMLPSEASGPRNRIPDDSVVPVRRGAGLGIAAQCLFCLLIRGRAFFADLGQILGNVSGSLANGDPAFPDASRFVSELQPTPLLAEDYGRGTLDRILNGFAAYADGTVNSLGGWTVLLFALGVIGVLIAVTLLTAFRVPSEEAVPTDVFTDADPAGHESSCGAGSARASRDSLLTRPQELLVTTAFLFVWLACGLVIMLKGSRFHTIPTLPLGILCGIGAGLLPDVLRRASKNRSGRLPLSRATGLAVVLTLAAAVTFAMAIRPELGNPAAIAAGAAVLVLGLLIVRLRRVAAVNIFALGLVISPCMATFGFAYSAVPDGSDLLANAAACIRERTSEDTAIASWWDFGYYYEYEARRLTLGDGGNFNSEWNYWLGQALITDSEVLARRIFQMLAAGGLDATHLLMQERAKQLPDSGSGADNAASPAAFAAGALKDILPRDRDDARSQLLGKYSIPDDVADRVLALTHPENAPQICLVLTDDMIPKLWAISTYGQWEFAGDPPFPNVRTSLTAKAVPANGTAVFPLSGSGRIVEVTADSNGAFSARLLGENGAELPATLRFSPKDGLPAESGVGIPTYPEPTGGASVIYLREEPDGSCSCLVCDAAIADSVLIRGFMTRSDALIYRSTVELPTADGTAHHEASVWLLEP